MTKYVVELERVDLLSTHLSDIFTAVVVTASNKQEAITKAKLILNCGSWAAYKVYKGNAPKAGGRHL